MLPASCQTLGAWWAGCVHTMARLKETLRRHTKNSSAEGTPDLTPSASPEDETDAPGASPQPTCHVRVAKVEPDHIHMHWNPSWKWSK